MNFFVWNSFHLPFVYQLCHNLENRVISFSKKKVTGSYKGVDVNFYFNNFGDFDEDVKKEGYHIISRTEIVKRGFFIEPPISSFQNKLGFPDCLKKEYETITNEIESDFKWILFWNYGENIFVHIPKNENKTPEEINLLNKFIKKGIFVTDNFIENSPHFSKIIASDNIRHFITNDLYMWNTFAKIFYANEFSPIYKKLNYDYKLAVSFRSPKKHRIEICNFISELNRDDIFLSYSSHFFERKTNEKYFDGEGFSQYDETFKKLKSIKNLNINNVGDFSKKDYENLLLISNDETPMEHDYYHRILSKAPVVLLDETHAYNKDSDIPMNLSEKTYILILANKPFLSTHHYPLDIIKKYILNIEHPYYTEIKKCTNNSKELVNFINHFLDNFESMYPPLKKYTEMLNTKLKNILDNENSFLEHMTTKI
jgi:hypothetical protein